jgi:hypothetical protein
MAQVNSIPTMRATVESISAVVQIPFDPKACTSVSKVVPFRSQMVINYDCPVPESARPKIRAEFAARGWEPEKILGAEMFKLRKSNQTASLYCQFKAPTCWLHLEFAPKSK